MEWRVIDGFAFYDVSANGQVRSWRNNRWGRSERPRLLKPGTGKNGYPLVVLQGRTESGAWFQKPLYVHRLVAHAFIGPCPADHEVNHKNSDRSDPRASNLEYVTSSGNNAHAIAVGHMRPPPRRRGSENGNSKLTNEIVRAIRTSPATLATLAKQFNCSIANVSDIRRRRIWRHIE